MSKIRLTVDFIMIVGKYLESSRDFINVMKVCRKYRELVSMYKFNPISDTTLFENIQTQHFYGYKDLQNKKEDMFRYVYWCPTSYSEIEDLEKNIYKNVVLTRAYKELMVNGHFTVPDCVNTIEHNTFKVNFELTSKHI